MSHISGIYIAPEGGAPLTAIDTASLEAGRGIVGDRYYEGTGQFSDRLRRKHNDDWQITLIEAEEIDAFVAAENLKFTHSDFRRNIVTTGVRLNDLVECTFSVDGIPFKGVRLCEPCTYLARMLTDEILPAMVGRSGLRAQILNSGDISVGGRIEI